MNTRTETWKRMAPALKTMAIALGLAWGVGGSAMAATEEASFIARVQANQAIAVAAGDHVGAITSAPNIDSEATSFIARVQAGQGITPSGIATHDAMSTGSQPSGAMATVAGGEAESFITRVEASQGIGPRRKS